ncbi:chromatin modification- protein eaf6 [Coemansia furcata]|nr:chromatin modification- protein eaf6 [Coemansia furcata]
MSTPQNEDTESKQQAGEAVANTESDKDSTATVPLAKAKGSTNGAKESKITKKMLKESEQELFQLLLKKKQLDRNLIETETSIYDFETSYFEISGQEGNIVHGFDGYLNTGRSDRRQMHFTEGDRIFSQSSATFKKAQEAKITASLLDSDTDDSDDTSQLGRKAVRKQTGSTIKHNSQRAGTPTPGGVRGGGGGTKKIRLSIDSGN